MIIGGQAALIYREPRFTADIDITLGINVDSLDIMIQIINELDLKIIVKKTEEFVEETLVLPTIDEITGFRVEFIFSFSDFEKEAILRANKVKIDDCYVNYCSLEDLIVYKIIASRAKDFEDIENMLKKNKIFNKDLIITNLMNFDKSLSTNYVDIFNKLTKK